MAKFDVWGCETMGMSDKQFDAYNRQLINQIQEVIDKLPDSEEKDKLKKIVESLQKSLEG